MLVCVSAQPAAACEQAGGVLASALSGDDSGADEGPTSPTSEPGVEMPAMIGGPTVWPLLDGAAEAPVGPAPRLAAAPFLGAPLRPPCV